MLFVCGDCSYTSCCELAFCCNKPIRWQSLKANTLSFIIQIQLLGWFYLNWVFFTSLCHVRSQSPCHPSTASSGWLTRSVKSQPGIVLHIFRSQNCLIVWRGFILPGDFSMWWRAHTHTNDQLRYYSQVWSRSIEKQSVAQFCSVSQRLSYF